MGREPKLRASALAAQVEQEQIEPVTIQAEPEQLSEELDPALEAESEAADDRPVQLPLSAQLGSLLFVSPKPLSIESLADLTRTDQEDVEAELGRMRETFTEELHGFSLQEIAGAWQLRTSPRAARVVQRLIPPRARRLSRAAAETLAVVAYKQPVQRAEIEAIRGVDALPTLRTLLDARLIRIVGRESSPGQPALYGTTSMFLEKFGLRDLSELPTVREILELAKEPGEVDSISTEDVFSDAVSTDEGMDADDEADTMETDSDSDLTGDLSVHEPAK